MNKEASCANHSPSWFVGHWRDWHRGHGCDQDDGKTRSDAAKTEIAQMAENATTGYLTDAELRFLRASTTSGNDLLVRALDELAARRTEKSQVIQAEVTFDHSRRSAKYFEPLLGYCVCLHCQNLPVMTADKGPGTMVRLTRDQIKTLSEHPILAANKQLIDMLEQLLADCPHQETFEVTLKETLDQIAKGSA